MLDDNTNTSLVSRWFISRDQMEEAAETAQLRQPKTQGELQQALREMCFCCTQTKLQAACVWDLLVILLSFFGYACVCVCVACNVQCMIRALPVLFNLPLCKSCISRKFSCTQHFFFFAHNIGQMYKITASWGVVLFLFTCEIKKANVIKKKKKKYTRFYFWHGDLGIFLLIYFI